MTRKFLTMFLVCTLLFSITVPALAQDSSEPTEATEPSETSEPTEETTEPTEPTEPSETVPEPSETPVVDVSQGSIDAIADAVNGSEAASEPTDPLTVNVSDESIEAIANAVSSGIEYKYSYQYVIPVGDYNYIIDTNDSNLFSDYLVVAHYTDSYTQVKFSLNAEYYLNSQGRVAIKTPGLGTSWHTVVPKDTVYSVESFIGICTTEIKSIGTRGICWSNRHIYDSNTGSLIYESPYEPPIQYTISFNTGFEDLVVDSVFGSSGESIVAPELVKEGYKFDGWYLDQELTLPFIPETFTISGDATLYANWIPYYTINFDTGIEGYEINPVKVLAGEGYFVPTFSYAGHEFFGAYSDQNREYQFVNGTPIESDITLYLRFEEIVYNFGAELAKLNERMEGLIYVQMAQSVMLSVILIGLFLFRKRDGLGC